MRPGKQLFPLNYNNIINNKEIKYNIKAIKLLIRETYGGNRTYINQIMFFEQSAEEVKDLLCSNDLNKYYKLNKKNIKQNIIRNNYNTEKNTLQKNKTQIIKYNNNIIANKGKNNSKKKIKNKTFEEKQEQSDIYLLNDITNGKEETPMTKMPNRQIKTDVKNNSKKIQKKLNLNKDNNENLTPNKYLKRLKNINKGNNTSNYSNHNIKYINNFGLTLKDNHSHIKQNLENNNFNTSVNNKSEINSFHDKNKIKNYDDENNNMNNFEEEELPEESQKNSKIYQLENELKNDYYNHYINGKNNNYNNKTNSEYKEENDSTFTENRQKLYKTHQNINYNKRNNNIYNNLINTKSDNNSSIFTEQNQNEISYNNNNYSQRYSIVTINENYNNMKKQRTNLIKQKLDYLEGNILEIKKTLKEISEGFAFCVSKEFIINNFREQIISICEEIYNEYYQNNISKNNNTNIINEKNGNDSLMTNSNYISQNNENVNDNNKQLEIELENQINQKLDEKLGTLQNNIFDKYLKPTINKIGNSMKKNIEQIQYEVDNLEKQNINNTNEISKEDLSYKLSTSKIRNQKFDEINKIGERLYNKLLEKEKKLKLLKKEKAKFLNDDE